MSSARHCSDGPDDELIAKVVVEIDLDFWPVFRLGWSVPTGELQNELSEFAEREKAERDADWAAEDRLDRRRSWEDGL